MSLLACPECNTRFSAPDINEPLGIARCRSCNAVLDLRSRESRPAHRGQTEARIPAPPPENFKVVDAVSEFSIEWRWFSPVAFFLVFFCLFWDGFMIAWFTISISSGAWPMALFGTLHGAVGVGLTYYTLCLFVERTQVRLTRTHLEVRHTPLPWKGSATYAVTDIKQLYAEQNISNGKNGTTVTYSLMAVMQDGSRKKLLGGLDEGTKVLWLERALESHMDKVDVPVEGAYTGAHPM